MSTAEAVCNCGGQTYWQQAHGWCSCISEGLRYSVYLVYQGEQGSRGNLHAASYPYAVVWSKADAWFKGFVWGLWNSQMVWLGLKLSHTVVVNLQIRLKGSQGSTLGKCHQQWSCNLACPSHLVSVWVLRKAADAAKAKFSLGFRDCHPCTHTVHSVHTRFTTEIIIHQTEQRDQMGGYYMLPSVPNWQWLWVCHNSPLCLWGLHCRFTALEKKIK